MTIEHVLTQSDTLFSLAEKYLNDAKRWREISEYNKLDAPYLAGSREEAEGSVYGSGYLKVQRSNYTNVLVIPSGWSFKTKPSLIGGAVKVFRTTEETVVQAGAHLAYVHVRSDVGGDYGNVAEGVITLAGIEFDFNSILFDSITNEKPFTGGASKRILTIGDSIYIPSEDGRNFAEPSSIRTMLEFIGGEDLVLEPAMGFVRTFEADEQGDIKSLSGLANIEQAINDRLMTEKGEFKLHPEYGTNLASVIGTARTPYTQKLAEIEIYEALAYEDRVTNVRITSLVIEVTTIYVDIAFNPANTSREAVVNLELNYGRRG